MRQICDWTWRIFIARLLRLQSRAGHRLSDCITQPDMAAFAAAQFGG
ncbi:hypothetical protein QFZ94_006695 [Paraburkholderia sp. JPY465]